MPGLSGQFKGLCLLRLAIELDSNFPWVALARRHHELLDLRVAENPLKRLEATHRPEQFRVFAILRQQALESARLRVHELDHARLVALARRDPNGRLAMRLVQRLICGAPRV